MEFKHIKNIQGTESADIYLYDAIGSYYEDGILYEGINGSYFNSELQYLQENVSHINIHINSGGGSVLDGLSIVSAILNSKIPVDVYIDGMCASIACVIALCGKKVYMKDYGMLMMHNPSGGSDDALDAIKKSLVKILSNNSALTPEQVIKMMDNETWLNPEEALQMGLINEIIKTDKKNKVATNKVKNSFELMKVYNKILTPNTEMKLVKNSLSLDENVNEAVVVDSIEKLKADKATLEKELLAESALKKELQDKLDTIEVEKAEAKKLEIESMINSFNVKDEEKAEYTELAKTNFTLVKNMLTKIYAEKPADIRNDVRKSTSPIPNSEDRSTWDYRKWDKEDNSGLQKMKTENPALHESLLNRFLESAKNK